MDIEERINELTVRVNELTELLTGLYHAHPELCSHRWEWAYGTTYHCSICGRNREEDI